MKVFAEQTGNMAFTIDQDGHKLIVDAEEKHGGENKGPSPKGLLLSGLVGCTGMDVTAILKKMHVSYDTFKLEAETFYTDEHPKVFTDITTSYIFTGDYIDAQKVAKAVTLSEEKYCGVSAMLGTNRKITPKIIINGEEFKR